MKKKGSTVRTVIAVVVCIIAFFAVIYLITILVNISESYQRPSDTAMIDNACKVYYYGMLSGHIVQGGAGSENIPDTLPTEGMSKEERKDTALGCTVGGALIYSEIDVSEVTLTGIGADEYGDIYKLDDESRKNSPVITSISTDTTLKELGYSWRNDYSDDLEKTIITNDK